MVVKVVGIGGVYSGNYQGYEYSKVNVYVDHMKVPKNGVGTTVEVLKCPSDSIPADLKVNDLIEVLYNRYGRIESIEIQKK